MAVVIFGGSFNPPHLGHEAIVNAVTGAGHNIVVMPCFQSLYGKPLESFADRLMMSHIMVQDNSKAMVSDWEINNHDTNATIELMDRIVERNVFGYLGNDLAFVMGEDNAGRIDKWVQWQELINKYIFIIIRRGGSKVEYSHNWWSKPPHSIIELKDDYSTVSSTDFRTNKNESIINPMVLKYIKKNHLYGY